MFSGAELKPHLQYLQGIMGNPVAHFFTYSTFTSVREKEIEKGEVGIN